MTVNEDDLSATMRFLIDFHTVFELPVHERPTLDVSPQMARLRADLIVEEAAEFADATARTDLVALADALADIVYAAYGAAVTYGIDLDATLREVHRSNMSKIGRDGRPVTRADGKILKSDTYEPPRVAVVLEEQSALPVRGFDRAQTDARTPGRGRAGNAT